MSSFELPLDHNSYFIPKGYWIAFIVRSYLHFLQLYPVRLSFFTQPDWINIFLNKFIWYINESQTVTITPGPREPKISINEKVLYTLGILILFGDTERFIHPVERELDYYEI